MNYDQQKTIKEFYDDFSKRVNDTVVSLEMASFEASPAVLDELHMEAAPAAKELWGLLVFCSHSMYFYVHPYESAMSMMIRQAARGKEPKEQLLNISELNSVAFSKVPRRWYEFSFLSSVGKLCMEYCNEQGNKHFVYMTLQHKADVVLEKINSVLKA